MANVIEKIDIIIPNKSNFSDLYKCLDSMKKYIDVKKYKIETIIIDDNSSKDERELFLTKIEDFKSLNIYPIFLNKHYGFTKAINTGLTYSLNKKLKPKYIAFLHSDTKILKNWFENLIEKIENDFFTLCIGSITLNEKESQCISNVSKMLNKDINLDSYLELMRLAEDSENIENNYEEDLYTLNDQNWDSLDCITFTDDNANDKISLFSAVFKIEAFEKYGLFNEDLISSIKVENEFCQRLIKNNKNVKLNPKSFVYHKCNQIQTNVNYEILKNAALNNIEILNSLNNVKINKKRSVIYTYVRENEKLPKITNFDTNVDYVCFTNNKNLYENKLDLKPWIILNAENFINVLQLQENILNNIDLNVKLFFKYHPHLFFKNYDNSVWFNSSIINNIKGETKEYIKLINPKNFILTLNSSKYNCSYMKLVELWKTNNINDDTYEKVSALYRWFRFPLNNGFADTNILIRKHNDERSILCMNKIWNNILKYQTNEELFFNLTLWCYKYDYSYINNKLFYKKYIDMKEI